MFLIEGGNHENQRRHSHETPRTRHDAGAGGNAPGRFDARSEQVGTRGELSRHHADPVLARLLKTDANTLLSFQDDITAEQNLAIQRETDRLVREEGYDVGFRYAVDAMREYPACDQLACILTMYLDGALSLYGASEGGGEGGAGEASGGVVSAESADDQDEYRSTIDANYRRLASSAEPAVREMATGMLIAQAMQDEDYAQAQELVDTLSDATPFAVDKEERQAAIYARTGRLSEAQGIWQRRVLRLSNDLQTALSSLVEIAIEQGRLDDADEVARCCSSIMRFCDAPAWMSDASLFEVAAARCDAAACLEILEGMLQSIEGEIGAPWRKACCIRGPTWPMFPTSPSISRISCFGICARTRNTPS